MKNSQEIRFIDREYKTLFTLPNGGFIKLLAEYPETSCQGLFNQIHKKTTKKVPEALPCS